MSGFERAMWGVAAGSAGVAVWAYATMPDGDDGDFDFSLSGDARSCGGCRSGTGLCEASWGDACCPDNAPHYATDGKCYETFPFHVRDFVICGCPVF